MIGDGNHHHGMMVQVPPWTTLIDDNNIPAAGISPFSPRSPNALTTIEDYAYFLRSDAALRRYLEDQDLEDGSGSGCTDFDITSEAYACDAFRMYEFKVRKCARGRSHDWTDCPYAHPARRHAGGTRGSTRTRAPRARSSARGTARRGTGASSRTACSSAGSTRTGTARSRARTARAAAGACASSRTRRSSSACRRRRRAVVVRRLGIVGGVAADVPDGRLGCAQPVVGVGDGQRYVDFAPPAAA
ncbi:hypothetical protein OSB04_020377 [Centaurea solstitialis]|uniref:AtC3H23-like CCCH zinc finger domain-containing protein n=1 Tax=Centaurea solstitialis TaxID=347529 RepID=A0AA38WF63_9ASTR|nr:hypothetical protein OSB04_020377 [Centaurea solstitialis]